MLLLTLLLALAGCRCGDGPDVRQLTEVQTACLAKDGHVRVGYGGCIAPACDQVVRGACTARVEGQAVVVEGSVAVRKVGDACTTGCKGALATCTGDVIDDPTGLAVNAKLTPKLVRCWDVR